MLRGSGHPLQSHSVLRKQESHTTYYSVSSGSDFGLVYIFYHCLEHTKKAIQKSAPAPDSATVSPARSPVSAHTCAQTSHHDPPTGTLRFSQEVAYFLCVHLVNGHKWLSIITFLILCQGTLVSSRWTPNSKSLLLCI